MNRNTNNTEQTNPVTAEKEKPHSFKRMGLSNALHKTLLIPAFISALLNFLVDLHYIHGLGEISQ
jgi:hypothetical protein